MLLLSWNFLFSGESECTRPNHHCKISFLTQPDDDVSAVNNKYISVGKLQGRSHGATRAPRVRAIRTALTTPPEVRVRMISNTILHIKCHQKRVLINLKLFKLEIIHVNIAYYSNTSNQDLLSSDLENNLDSLGARGVNVTDPARTGPNHKPQTTNESTKVQRDIGNHSDDEHDNKQHQQQ